jgi:hypothetical protein
MLLTDKDCMQLYGIPEREVFMTLLVLPPELHVGNLPAKVYCGKDMAKPLLEALHNIVNRGLVLQIESWNGCFAIRQKRGNEHSRSLHSWGLAVDINKDSNELGEKPTMSKELVKCFKDVGFDWGGDWSHPDGMHFQLSRHLVGLK